MHEMVGAVAIDLRTGQRDGRALPVGEGDHLPAYLIALRCTGSPGAIDIYIHNVAGERGESKQKSKEAPQGFFFLSSHLRWSQGVAHREPGVILFDVNQALESFTMSFKFNAAFSNYDYTNETSSSPLLPSPFPIPRRSKAQPCKPINAARTHLQRQKQTLRDLLSPPTQISAKPENRRPCYCVTPPSSPSLLSSPPLVNKYIFIYLFMVS